MSTPYEQAVEAAARFTYSYETPRSWETADDALRMIYRAQATRHVSAALRPLLAPIEALCRDTDGNWLDPRAELPVGEFIAALASIKGQPS